MYDSHPQTAGCDRPNLPGAEGRPYPNCPKQLGFIASKISCREIRPRLFVPTTRMPVLKQVIQAGDEETFPRVGDLVTIVYQGWLYDPDTDGRGRR